jgi:hypothetical protein
MYKYGMSTMGNDNEKHSSTDAMRTNLTTQASNHTASNVMLSQEFLQSLVHKLGCSFRKRELCCCSDKAILSQKDGPDVTKVELKDFNSPLWNGANQHAVGLLCLVFFKEQS